MSMTLHRTQSLFLTLAFLLIFLNESNAQPKPHTTAMETNKKYSVEIIRYTIPTDMQTNFEKAYSDAGVFLKQSSYCVGYEMLKGEDEPTHYIVRIHWTSTEDHLQKFRKSGEFHGFFALVKPYFNNIEEMKHYTLTNMAMTK